MTTASNAPSAPAPAVAALGAGALAAHRLRRQPETGTGGDGSGEFTYLGQTENTTIIGTLETLAEDQCTAEERPRP